MPKKLPNPVTLNNTFISKAVALICLLILIPGLFLFFFRDRIYPSVSVANISLTGLTRYQAINKLEQIYNERSNQSFEFYYPDASYSASPSQKFNIKLSNSTEANIKKAVDEAFAYGHAQPFLKPQRLNLEIEFNSNLQSQIQQIAQIIDVPAIDSQLKFETSEINVTSSQDGIVLDQETLNKEIKGYLNSGNQPFLQLPLKIEKPKLDYESALKIKNRLDELKVSPLVLNFKDQSFTLDLPTILTLIDLQKSNSIIASTTIFDTPLEVTTFKVGTTETSDAKLAFNERMLESYLKSEVAPFIDREVEEPLFQFDGKRVTQFRPPQSGQKLDIKQSSQVLSKALATEKQTEVALVVNVTDPKNKLANDLGIKELIGSGVSYFAGSIPNRIYNVDLAASRINGILIAPGDTFSFVKTIGDISGASGYKQAYIIKDGRTVLDDGGGVCQVSTTLFRSVLNSGLPIVKRVAHAYRVGYYEQGFPPGLDATIFSPSVDFQFKNDTNAYVLIQASVKGTTLYVNLYGTSDGRVAKVSTPIITNVTPAPPELRQDDPTLPKGTIKQVDWAAQGAIVTYTRTVTRNGETIINETFRSNYRPWQAVYLVGTGG